MKAKLSFLLLFILMLSILSSCAINNQQKNSYNVLNNSYNEYKPNWFQTIVLSLFQIAKADKEKKYVPKVSVHPDNAERPLPFGQ